MLHFTLGDQMRLRSPEHHTKPVRVVFCSLVDLVKLVLAFRSTDEGSESLPVHKCGPNNLIPNARAPISKLVKNNTVETKTAQAVRIVSAVKSNASPIDEINSE